MDEKNRLSKGKDRFIRQSYTAQRKVFKELGWIQRNPYTFSTVFSIVCLGILFSKPIYDVFIAPREDFAEPPTRKR